MRVPAAAPGCCLRHRRMEEGDGQHRLPRRIRRQLLQRAACAGSSAGRVAHHAPHGRSAGPRQAGGEPSPQPTQRPLRHPGRTHAGGPSGACRVVARQAPDLGGIGRACHGRVDQAPAHGEAPSRTRLSRLPGPDAPDPQPWRHPDGGGLRTRPGGWRPSLPLGGVDSRQGSGSPQPLVAQQAELALPDHANVRGPGYYH